MRMRTAALSESSQNDHRGSRGVRSRAEGSAAAAVSELVTKQHGRRLGARGWEGESQQRRKHLPYTVVSDGTMKLRVICVCVT